MADGLYEHEDGPEHQRKNGGEDQLRGGIGRALGTGGVHRQHQGQGGQGGQHGQCRHGAFDAEIDDAVAQAAGQQAQADHAVAHDHQRGIHGIAGQGRGGLATGQHHRDDQRDLDHRHRQGQHQGAKGFTHAVGDYLGVMHGGQHRGDQRGTGHAREQPAERHAPGQHEQGAAGERDEQAPQGHVMGGS